MSICDKLRNIFRRSGLSEEEVELTLQSNLEYLFKIRPPEVPGVLREVIQLRYRFMQDYPGISLEEAHQKCIESHPEWWPNTGTQEYAY